MAWERIPVVGDLVCTWTTDGMDTHEASILNCKSAAMYDDQKSYILNNPFSPAGAPQHTVRSNQGAAYTEIENLGVAGCGDIDLQSFYNILPTGYAMYVWRRSMGKSYRIAFTKGNYNFTVSFIAAGVSVFTTTLGVYSGAVNMKQTLSWFIDEDNSRACVYVPAYYENTNYLRPRVLKIDYFYSGTDTNTINAINSVVFPLLINNVPVPVPTPSTDPYADGGTSTGTTTGTGTFDDTSDAIADPSTPTLSPSIGNFVNQYVVSPTALSNFGTWLYSGGNIFDNLAKVFQSPMEAIINVGILPYKPTFDPNAYVDIKVGGLNSNVQARKITDNYEVVDMGKIDFDPFYGSALDYNPYTKCYIYLPYCGTFPLNVDEIMGHEISLKYYCDSLSGDCVAVISDEERVLEQFRGNTFIQVPITARDFSSIYTNALNSAISLAAGIATVAATGGVSAPVAVGMGTSMASNAMNSKTHYSRSGGFSGIAGFMSVQKPYVILTIPRQCLPDKQNEFQGYPLFVTKTLSDCSGFTKVYEIHLDGLDCTDAEMKEIYELLKGGVVL